MGEGGGASGNISTDTTLLNKETWNVTKMLRSARKPNLRGDHLFGHYIRGHVEDIYDACWSSSSSLLVTGSVDNTAIIWDVSKGIIHTYIIYAHNSSTSFYICITGFSMVGQALCKLADSKQYVQGVAWDPIGHYLATLSNDRYIMHTRPATETYITFLAGNGMLKAPEDICGRSEIQVCSISKQDDSTRKGTYILTEPEWSSEVM